MTYKQFIFDDYQFDTDSRTLRLHYAIDDALHFTETYSFNFDVIDYDSSALDRACQLLFFLAGVSYYKTYVPSEIIVKRGEIDPALATFLSETYQKGLGEFFYMNGLDPHTSITFPVTTATLPKLSIADADGLLIGVGGGKDSLVSIELLKEAFPDSVTWSMNHRNQLEPLVQRVGTPHAWVEREWDPQLKDLNAAGAYNGHVPISALFAAMGVIVCILSGKRDAVVSNEYSANEPTLHYDGMAINHQYSKSQAFEQAFQRQLCRMFGDDIRYYSFLRPLSELMISRLFAQVGFEKYKDVFSSCNRAFVHSSNEMSWCGECAKCAFVFLMLTPFIERTELEQIWHGKNLLLDTKLQPTYKQLLGIQGDKPFDCVGEIKEARTAMRLAFNEYPDLQNVYQFELPDSYDYTLLASHEMTPEIYTVLTDAIQQFAGQHE